MIVDIKIRAKDHKTLKVLIDMMVADLRNENHIGQIDVAFSAEKDGDTITIFGKK